MRTLAFAAMMSLYSCVLPISRSQNGDADSPATDVPLVAMAAMFGGDVDSGGGVGAYMFTEDEVGAFFQFKSSSIGEGLTGLGRTGPYARGTAINLGATFRPLRHLGIYAGLGYGDKKDIGLDPDESGLNVVGGVVGLFGRLAVDVSYDTFLETTSFGLGFSLKF